MRPSNRERGLRVLALLDIQAGANVLEIGFGPGLAIERVAQLATGGSVVGIDHSELVWRQARRRNAGAIGAGRVELMLGSAERLPNLATQFDKVFAVNVYMFWQNPVGVPRSPRDVMRPGGTIALVLQPRNRGATNEDARQVAERIAASLRDAGFAGVRVEILEMAPVNTACVLRQAPSS